MKPTGAGSVMADHAPRVVEADSDQVKLWRALEYFPTPPWAARAGGELIASLDAAACCVAWEPACGEGHMAHGLGDYFNLVVGTDLHDHGWPGLARTLDFLDAAADVVHGVDWIITNPPFGAAAEFVRLGLERACRGVAILARMSWLESAGRYPLFFGAHPLSVLAPFAERVPMKLGEWDPKGSTATGYAWFIWMHPPALAAAARARVAITATTPVVLPIPPGTKARLTRSDDARLFGVKAAAPLFEGVEL